MSFTSLAVALLMTLLPVSPANPDVQVAQGRLIGRQVDQVASFKGIPFAAAPVGALR